MSKQDTPTYTYNETQKIPTMYGLNAGNADVLKKIVGMNLELRQNECHQNDEFRVIRETQKAFEEQLSKLFQLCETINNSVSDVKEKLSQYDIDDVGETFEEPVEDAEVCESLSSQIESAILSKSGQYNPISMSNIDYTANLNLSEPEPEPEPEPVKPKRKYNRKK